MRATVISNSLSDTKPFLLGTLITLFDLYTQCKPSLQNNVPTSATKLAVELLLEQQTFKKHVAPVESTAREISVQKKGIHNCSTRFSSLGQIYSHQKNPESITAMLSVLTSIKESFIDNMAFRMALASLT